MNYTEKRAKEIVDLWQKFPSSDNKEFIKTYPQFALEFTEWMKMPIYDGKGQPEFYLKQLEECVIKYESKLAKALR